MGDDKACYRVYRVSLLCAAQEANKPKRRGVHVRDMPLFGKLADQDGTLMSQNSHLGGHACQVLLGIRDGGDKETK